jgi:hypothetical protein
MAIAHARGIRSATTLASIAVVLVAAGIAVAVWVRSSDGPRPAAAQAALARLALPFVENGGQLDRRVAYSAHVGAASLFFTGRGVTFALAGGSRHGAGAARGGWAVQQAFLGSRAARRPQPSRRGQALVSYFVGPRSHWKTGLRTYGRLVYRNVWPGIDVVYSGVGRSLEYSFVIRPGADPDAISLAYRGASAVRLRGTGQLAVSTPVGTLKERRPVAYQHLGGRRVPVSAAFVVPHGGSARAHGSRYGFSLGAYDRSRPVVLDPVVFGYAGYLGGSGDDRAWDNAVDGDGNSYMAGYTTSPDFPATPGSLSTPRGDRDAFVAKLDRTGKLVYADYVGGAGHQDTARGLAIDQAGNAYITGPTDSSERGFPVTVGPDLTLDGPADLFVAKIDPSGTRLVYAGYVGGDGGDSGRDIAVDGNGAAYVGGTTDTADSSFPAVGGLDPTYGGGKHDGFVAKVNAAGTRLVYSGYIGGSGDEDNVRGVAVDGAGSLYLTGHVDSPESTLPIKVGPDRSYNGDHDGYVAKVNPSGTQFDYFGYVGGAGREQPRRIDVDREGNAYIAGSTDSNQGTFPVKVGPDLTFNGTRDAFVTKVKPDGTGLVYSGYIGGTGDDQAYGLEVKGHNAYVVGLTTSSPVSFPVFGGPDVTYNGSQDGFIAKVNDEGTGLGYAGYIGGGRAEVAQGVGVDSADNAYVSGVTASLEETFPTIGVPDNTFNGGQFDAFVAKIAPVTGAHITVDVSGPAHRGVPFTVTAVMRDGAGNRVINYDRPATWTSLDGGIAPSAPANFVQGISTSEATVSAAFRGDRITVSSADASGQSGALNVLGPLDHIALSGMPGSVSVGQTFTVSATAKDAVDDTLVDYAAPATWSDRGGTLKPATPVAFDQGISSTTAQVGGPYHDDRITLTSGAVSAQSALFTVHAP